MYDDIIGSDDDNRQSQVIIDNEIHVEDFLNAKDDAVENELIEKSAKVQTTMMDNADVILMGEDGTSRLSSEILTSFANFEEKSKLSAIRQKPQLLSQPFKEILEIAQRNLRLKSQKLKDLNDEIRVIETTKTSISWASKYKPSKFTHLISDDMINRLVLKWMKLWDPFIFKSPLPSFANQRANPRPNFPKKREFKSAYELKMDKLLEFDEINLLPHFRILLINGEPGIGKTMLVHIVAKHCGYDVMEINASDERTPENFKSIFTKASTVKNSIKSGNPICLVFDEIDGAPKKSLDVLLEYCVNTNDSDKKKKLKFVPRPIICICNNLFAPSLFKLKQHAFVINFPPISHDKIVSLLKKIVSIEKPKIIPKDDYLLRLVDETNGDIRSSINNLQFHLLSIDGQSTFEVVAKDRQLSLYDMWKSTFHSKPNQYTKNNQANYSNKVDQTLSNYQHINQLIHQCSSSIDRYLYGLFDNYCYLLEIPSRFRHFQINQRTVTCTEYFQLYDLMNGIINRYQHYGSFYDLKNTLPAYALHVTLSYDSLKHPYKFVYPSNYYQNVEFFNRNKEVIRRFQNGANKGTSDLIYYLSLLIQPNLKNINIYMMTESEKNTLQNAAAILLEKNIAIKSYQRHLAYNHLPNVNNSTNHLPNVNSSTEPLIDYQFEPNIRQLCTFPGVIRFKPTISGNIMQLLKTTMENLSMMELRKKIIPTNNKDSPLKPKTISNNIPTTTHKKDFFGRTLKENTNQNEKAVFMEGNTIEDKNTYKKSTVKFDRHLYYVYKHGSSTCIVRRTKYNEIMKL